MQWEIKISEMNFMSRHMVMTYDPEFSHFMAAIMHMHAHAGDKNSHQNWCVTTSTISGNSQSSKSQNNCSQCLLTVGIVFPSWISIFVSIIHSPADSYHVFHETAFWVGDLPTQEENKSMTRVVPSLQRRRLDVLLSVHSLYTALLLQHKE